MASVQTSSYGGRYLKLTVVEESTNVTNNTSVLRWTLESIGGSAQYYSVYNWGVWINNQPIYDTQTTYWDSYTFPAATGAITGTITVKHKEDGTAPPVEFTLKGCVYNNRDNTYNSSISLSTIARASQPSCVTYPNTTNCVGNLGDTITIYTNRKSSLFTHTVKYEWGDKSETIATGVTNNTQWTIPKDFAENISNGTSGMGAIIVDTYNGSTKVGSKSVSFTAIIPDTPEFQPSISSVSLSEVGQVPASWGFYVQNISKIKGIISASGAYGSTISNYSASINNESFITSTFTTSIITLVNPLLKVTVTDTRGRKATYQSTITVFKYEVPTITNFISYRNATDPSKIDVSFSCSIYKLNSKNTKQFVFNYKMSKDSNYTSITIDQSKITFKELGDIIICSSTLSMVTSDTAKSYITSLKATDYFNSISSSDSFVNTIFKLINISSDKTAFAIGKLHERVGYIENALPQINYKNIFIENGDYRGIVLSCPEITDGKIIFNSSSNSLEFDINDVTYGITLTKK